MTLEQYWTILVKQWKLILICFVAVGLGAYIGSKLMTRLYQSSALVEVTVRMNNNLDYTNLLASDQLVDTEAQLATSSTVLRAVASNYPGLTPEALAQEVKSTSKVSTQLFEIDVLDASPTRAAALANDIAATLIKQQLQEAHLANSRFQQQLQQNLDATRKQIDATTAQISTLQAKGGNQTQISILQIQLAGLIQWQTALAQLELTGVQNGDFLRIAQVAEPNPKPVQPNVLLNTGGGLLIGLLLGLLIAVLFEQLDTRVRTPEALTQLLGWPVLATIWRARSSKKEDILNPTGQDSNIEAFRILRTNIGFSGIDKPLHSLMVTSAIPREGKSIIAANLAIFMAKGGKTTLLIDADFRHPVVDDLFDIPGDRMGLSNAILAFSIPATANASANDKFRASTTSPPPSSMPPATQRSLDPFINAVNIPNLFVMPSGPLPPNPSELLDSKAMQYLFKALSSCGAEVVIFDTSPLLGLSDTSILASKVDGTLVVVDITRARKGSIRPVKALLAQAGTRVLGCVVNKQRRSRKNTIYSYFYGTDEQKEGEDLDMEHAGSLPTLPDIADGLGEPGTTSELELKKQSEVENHSTNNVSSPAAPANAFDASDQTIKLSRDNRRQGE
jgi:Mrp family chromosome partitioning ATPase/capsular polysaccharide biosynthesis protein